MQGNHCGAKLFISRITTVARHGITIKSTTVLTSKAKANNNQPEDEIH
jgi:hypothetical protein